MNKKVMFLCHGAGNGGAERVITTIAGAFAEDGYTVSLVTTNKEHNDYIINPKVQRKIILSHAGNALSRTMERIIKLRKYIKEYAPDSIISFSTVPNMQALIASRGLKCKVIISERTDPSRYPTSNLGKRLRLFLYPYADVIVFQTNDARNYFPPKIKNKGVVIFNPIREDLPEPYNGVRENRIVGIGSLGEQKNWSISLKAAELFFKTHSEYRFDIFGEGPDKNRLQEYIDNSTLLRNRVFLRGFSLDAVAEMNTARMYISSSKYDGIPNSMLEALATGVPTIYTDCPVGGPKEFIINGFNGFLVPVNDSNALAEKMVELAENDDLCKRLSLNSVKIRKTLSLKKIVSAWEEVIEGNDI